MGLYYRGQPVFTHEDTRPVMRIVTLTADGWGPDQQTVSVPGVLEDEAAQAILVVPGADSRAAYYDSGTQCRQGAGVLTFSVDSVPDRDLTVYVTIFEVKHGSL